MTPKEIKELIKKARKYLEKFILVNAKVYIRI